METTVFVTGGDGARAGTASAASAVAEEGTETIGVVVVPTFVDPSSPCFAGVEEEDDEGMSGS